MASRFEGTLLGGAYGDALGWPQESRARTKSSNREHDALSLHGWTRRGGGRFQAFEEVIPAGTYSDDTQLVIAVARSRLAEKDWWLHLAGVELPFWTAYQQGGGGATNRAAKSLLKGVLPWEAARDDQKKYFDAGGNGVAMRVAAHCFAHSQDDDFNQLARDVFTDGVLTHGHPVALVGALTFSFALWSALRLTETLRFGQLVDHVLACADQWSMVPDIEDRWPSWIGAALIGSNFWYLWEQTVQQQMRILEVASEGMKVGALAFDSEVLRDIGCFDSSISGAGTVAAGAAIYLASKHAASPIEGVAQAALAKGADTDTIASMTGNILGAVNGTDWLQNRIGRLQDRELLGRMAFEFSKGTPRSYGHLKSQLLARDLRMLFSDLEEGRTDLMLPYGLAAKVLGPGDVFSKSPSAVIDSWKIRDEWSQTLILRRVRKVAKPERPQIDRESALLRYDEKPKGARASRLAGFSLFAKNLRETREFYELKLGLEISMESPEYVQFGENLVLRENRSAIGGEGTIVYVEVSNIEERWNAISATAPRTTTSLDSSRGRPRFVCSDPDGRRVEVFQSI